MAAQIVLKDQQSTYGGPYGFYTVTLEPSNRTLNAVTVKCTVTAHLQFDNSETQYGVECSLYIGGAWHEFTLVPYGTWWRGTDPITATTTITVSGLGVAQKNITGIKFKATEGLGETSGPSLSATACSDLVIDVFGGVADINVEGVWRKALLWLNVEGAWRLVLAWVRDFDLWRSAGRVIDSGLMSIVDDGFGNVAITFTDAASVEQEGGSVRIAAHCIEQDASGNVKIM